MKHLKQIFFSVVILVLIIFGVSQFVLESDRPEVGGYYTELDVDVEYSDIEGTNFRKAVVTATLPVDMTENDDSIYILSRSMKAYVDGELRTSYEGNVEKRYGRTAAAYVEIPLTMEDAGASLEIDMEVDPGGIPAVYIGDRKAFWAMIQNRYGAELYVGIVAFVLSLLCILGGIWVSLVQKTYISIVDLGFGAALASAWIITNSVFRQEIFNNLSTTSNMPFFIISTMAFPFVSYVNAIQNGRYKKVFLIIQSMNVVDMFLCCIVYAFDITELSAFFPVIALCAVSSILAMVVTMLIDLVKGNIKEYIYAAVGMFSVTMCGVIQIFLYFFRVGIFSGIVLAVGLILIVIFSVINAFTDFSRMNNEKLTALAANKAKDVFLANMSHEIRTPINAILGMDEMIIRESGDATIKGYAMDVRNAGRNLLDIINDILDFSKIESGMMNIVTMNYDVRSLLHDILLMIKIKADEKGLLIETDIDEDIPSFLCGDMVRIRQIFVNILSNAVKYTKSGSVTWRIRSERADDRIILKCAVIDTGIGMKPEDLEHLFDRFVRADARKNYEVEGTGLGLAITAQLLTLMGSELKVESEYGKGSTFYFDLEQGIVNEEPIGDIGGIINYTRQEEESSVFTGSGRILVTDDQRMNRSVVKNLLKDSGLTIDEAESGKQCIEMTSEKEYDIILLDHMMPEMDGMETIRHLREDGKMQGHPAIIAMTANAVSGAEDSYMSSGFDGYLSKPVMPDELNHMLYRYLSGVSRDDTVISEANDDAGTVLDEDLRELLQKVSGMPEINRDYAMRFYQNEGQYAESLRDFREEIYNMSDALDDEYMKISSSYGDEGDLSDELGAFRIQVHAMKSAAYGIGAVALGGMAAFLEKESDEGNIRAVIDVAPHFLNEWLKYKEKL